MSEVLVRPMQLGDLEAAHKVFQQAFGTQIGVADPKNYRADSGMIETRFRRDPACALVAEIDGQIVGSNFVTIWGSFGFFGPLTIDPDHWGKGIAQKLLMPSMALLHAHKLSLMGLYTFSDSPKHVALYRKFGFWPRFLTAIMHKQIEARKNAPQYRLFSGLNGNEQTAALGDCRALCTGIYPALDPCCEVSAVQDQSLGDTVLLYRNNILCGFAVCHCGPGTEAVADTLYVKFAAIARDADANATLQDLMHAIEDLARKNRLETVIAATNLARKACFEAMSDAGYKTMQQGLAMHYKNDPGYNQTEVFVLDDWR